MQVRQRLDFLKESVTARRTYDGPSCTSVTTFRESFPVPNSQELKCFETVDHDGSSCLWRSVLQVRHRVQRVDFSTQIWEFLSVLGRDTHDGPSCPWRSVVGSVVSACFSRNKICCSKRLNRLLQIWAHSPVMWIICNYMIDASMRWSHVFCCQLTNWFL